MDHTPQMLKKKHDLLHSLANLPQKVLSLHGTENVSEFVLHDLCNARCFDIPKAAYIVDNPDFDMLKGVAGFSANEAFNSEIIWETPELFIAHMKEAPFNQKVRGLKRASFRKFGVSDQETSAVIGDYLGLTKPSYCSWQMKHDNHGILVYESANNPVVTPDIILNGVCLLGFCPVY